MLGLTFRAAGQSYVLEAGQVRAVAPLAALRPLPGAPPHIAGLAGFRGRVIPVVDLSVLLGGKPAPPLLSTRLLIVECPQPDGQLAELGLIAEQATETMTLSADDCQPLGISIPGAPWLGEVQGDPGRGVIRVRVEHLLPPELRAALHPALEAGP